MKNIKNNIENIISVCMFMYSAKKEGADIKFNRKTKSFDVIGYGYNETIKLF